MSKLRSTDLRWYRPWLGFGGRSWVTVEDIYGSTTRQPSLTLAMLTPTEWLQLDTAVAEGFAERSPTVQRIIAEDRVVRMPPAEALGRSVVQYTVRKEVEVTIHNLPLRICSAKAEVRIQNIATARRHGYPIDSVSVQMAGRRVGEAVEKYSKDALDLHSDTKLLIGVEPTLVDFGDSFEVLVVIIPVPHDFEVLP